MSQIVELLHYLYLTIFQVMFVKLLENLILTMTIP